MSGQCAKWGGSVSGWQANVQELRDFINARCLALEQELIDCYDLNGPHATTFDVDPPNSGEIKVNSVWYQLIHGQQIFWRNWKPT